ncbi:hypothetical protein ACWT_7013 [Actinoplanes sp. SE50]|uniref:hypothetical protein n=1 Tax=unclassified Actinoplanes TaxID=2626549 RepID=UPI00023EC396|nr:MULTISPECIES: hypothetical protein [unclassified Actinoplanes]AEV88024.1 hypothetical protein ACPL_7144 [Actinoplanes sp. SE50/110]ATO86428.1 hypothetical protein ACWT_7013 [Actinoplanes sp. SE50]SLM03843.1 hypothetical protein ACSP50_7142 [Actinoplanes sp. SE50/110]
MLLAEQIIRLLDIRLVDPLEILLEGDPGVDRVRRRLQVRAWEWAAMIEQGEEAEAVHIIARLIATLYPDDHAFAPPVEWWRTPLGQAVVRRMGHPFATTVSYATAGAMLGITRQAIHDLVRRGRLPRDPDGGVPVGAVRARLLAATPFTTPATAAPLTASGATSAGAAHRVPAPSVDFVHPSGFFSAASGDSDDLTDAEPTGNEETQ